MTQHPLYKHLMGLPLREPYTPEDREEYGPGSFYNIHFTCQDCDPCYGHQLYTWSTVYLDEDELYHRWGRKKIDVWIYNQLQREQERYEQVSAEISLNQSRLILDLVFFANLHAPFWSSDHLLPVFGAVFADLAPDLDDLFAEFLQSAQIIHASRS